VKHEQDLRLIARQATEVAALIKQSARGPRSFQIETVPPPARSPDVALQSIQIQLDEVAAAIEAYLLKRRP
jgi:hypothetical protein